MTTRRQRLIISLNIVLPCFLLCIAIENETPTVAPISGELNDHLRQVNSTITFVMLSKKTTAPGGVLAPQDTNQDGILLREARSQKRKATSPTPQDEELDQAMSNLEAIHQQVEERREKMLRPAELQNNIDEAAEEMRHIA
jgi:anion-transporting  ArsA/GET3 family ATPase